jgi:hypothetical protein
MFNLKLEKMW